jgi:hypothetical protein
VGLGEWRYDGVCSHVATTLIRYPFDRFALDVVGGLSVSTRVQSTNYFTKHIVFLCDGTCAVVTGVKAL